MSQMMLYIVPLILGRTFDMNKMEVGVDIFPDEYVMNPVMVENPTTKTKYKIVDNSKEARDFLDVSGSFSLNVKSGTFTCGASGSYLKDTYDKRNTVEVAIKATYETVTMSLPPDARPVDTWQLMSSVGTHYVRSITYGGELITSLRLISNTTSDKKHIMGAVEISGRIDIFDLGLEAEGGYKKEVADHVDRMDVKVFSSIPISTVPSDMDSLKRLLESFPDDMKKHNEGNGIPIRMELWPLSYFDSSRPDYIKNSVLEARLDSFEEKMDDLVNTRTAVTTWMSGMDQHLSEKQEKQVAKFYNEVMGILDKFYDVVGNLDISKGTDQLQPALDAYGTKFPGSYYHAYLQLRQSIADDQGAWQRATGWGVLYTHWGRTNCTASVEVISTGIAMGPGSYGGGSNFLCMPANYTADQESVSDKHTPVLRHLGFMLPNSVKSLMACSICRLATRGSVTVYPGKTACPRDWGFLYKGSLMNGRGDNFYTQSVCLDTRPDVTDESTGKTDIEPSWVHIAGSQTKEEKLLPCVVCSQ